MYLSPMWGWPFPTSVWCFVVVHFLKFMHKMFSLPQRSPSIRHSDTVQTAQCLTKWNYFTSAWDVRVSCTFQMLKILLLILFSHGDLVFPNVLTPIQGACHHVALIKCTSCLWLTLNTVEDLAHSHPDGTKWTGSHSECLSSPSAHCEQGWAAATGSPWVG